MNAQYRKINMQKRFGNGICQAFNQQIWNYTGVDASGAYDNGVCKPDGIKDFLQRLGVSRYKVYPFNRAGMAHYGCLAVYKRPIPHLSSKDDVLCCGWKHTPADSQNLA